MFPNNNNSHGEGFTGFIQVIDFWQSLIIILRQKLIRFYIINVKQNSYLSRHTVYGSPYYPVTNSESRMHRSSSNQSLTLGADVWLPDYSCTTDGVKSSFRHFSRIQTRYWSWARVRARWWPTAPSSTCPRTSCWRPTASPRLRWSPASCQGEKNLQYLISWRITFIPKVYFDSHTNCFQSSLMTWYNLQGAHGSRESRGWCLMKIYLN